ncbi:endonuclease/exonuclease/phosphatase family protein [Aestuariivivens insulae]|uniref:endonuclease/exonuclease/phosphatase family protein n=1 Tax=Aestuariivivens insulae TaxID=1621988 RepID=UPI001F561285|nr:endonuclease/exonuclease/phosphatase family protein [Aestuariivivens insulae]
MAWNILHGGNDIPNGSDHVIEIISQVDPDIILMVETYGSGKKIADSLGYHFHLIAPEGTALDNKNVNLSIFSKFPFGKRIDTEHPFYLGGREVVIKDQTIRLFSNWFHYLPWDDAPETMGKTSEELLAWEQTGPKYDMIQKVLPYLKEYASQTDSIPMIFGGDMNTPSHLDWKESTMAIHNNLVVPWYATKVLEDMGLIDTYRTLNPDVMSHPGITWDTKGKKDEHRIDYIYYKGPKLKAVKSESYKAHLGDPLKINGVEIPYPSDHGFVVTTFQFVE